jgi:predicted PurR-regulated permease PerM
MNQVISRLQSVLLRVILTSFLVVSAFFLSAFLGYGNSVQAQADPLTPEATSYQVDQTDAETFKDQAQDQGNGLIKNTQNKLESAADNIREKLNLDQPIYPGTKEFLNDVQDKAEDTVKGTQQAVKDAV